LDSYDRGENGNIFPRQELILRVQKAKFENARVGAPATKKQQSKLRFICRVMRFVRSKIIIKVGRERGEGFARVLCCLLAEGTTNKQTNQMMVDQE